MYYIAFSEVEHNYDECKSVGITLFTCSKRLDKAKVYQEFSEYYRQKVFDYTQKKETGVMKYTPFYTWFARR